MIFEFTGKMRVLRAAKPFWGFSLDLQNQYHAYPPAYSTGKSLNTLDPFDPRNINQPTYWMNLHNTAYNF